MEIKKDVVYTHYKGGDYVILELGAMEDTNEQVVVYTHHPIRGEFYPVWVRPLSEFKEKFKIN